MTGGVIFGAQREAPKSGPTLFASTFEKDGVIFGEYGNTMFFEEDFTTVAAELANSDKIVLESWHDTSISDRYVSEWEVGGGGGLVRLAGWVAGVGGVSCRVDVDNRGVWRQVDVDGTAVDNNSIG